MRRPSIKRESYLDIIGKHVHKYRLMMIIILSLFITGLVALIIYWNYDENSISPFIDNTYLVSQVVMAAISLGIIAILIIDNYKHIHIRALSIIFHAYAFLLMLWATGLCLLDLRIGVSPLVFMVVATAVSSLFVLQPYYFLLMAGLSFLSIFICNVFVDRYDFFSGPYALENSIYFVMFCILIVIVSFRHFNVVVKEYQALKKVEELTYHDELTGLLNERSYINKTEEINNNIKDNKIKPFAVILMDVNNLKATNDAYGHRYGCHLVVRTGHTLPELFKTSSLYHVGGDEFIAIIEGDDYDHFEERLEEFDKVCRYGLIKYEGQELVFSVARGYAKYEEGNLYKDVLQKADQMMYENKAEIKSTYKMKGR